MSQHDSEDASIADQVKAAFSAHRRVYGSPRLHAELRAQGIRCGQKRVARLMRVHGLAARRPRHRTVTTHRDPEAKVACNLLQRDFSAEQPNTKWVADTTSIWTAEGWLSLAVVLDLFSRMVVGWSMAAVKMPRSSAMRCAWPLLDADQRRGCFITPIVEARTPVRAIKRLYIKRA